MSFEIPARPGIKIYANESRTITIQQTGSGQPSDPFIDLHPADVPDFVKGLNKVLAQDLKAETIPAP